ncbi:MAG: hypothetical protein IAI50_01515 [Candidatus Eremiobacteraeota bacterium]|nr:hypothetical protein [Candidatus Eremiobacteraeota bacterium]
MRDETDGMLPGVREHDLLVRRPWTEAERRVVLHGLFGRLLIAIEPVICFVVFGALTAGLIFFPLPAGSKLTHWESAIVLAPIFGLAAFAFFAYAALLLVAPLRALIQTFSPIFIVDGYLRYRSPDRKTDGNSNGYIAVLSEERRMVAEWPSLGDVPLPDSMRPALIEFSFFGGVHRIDGRSTGVLPATMAPMGVGANSPPT